MTKRYVRTGLGGKTSTWFYVQRQDKLDKAGAKEIFCDERGDNKTTYVRKKIFSQKKQDWVYPKYVECDYVE